MHRKSKQWLKGIDISHISRCLALMVIIMTFSLVTSFGLEAQEESGTLEELLNKLEDFQKDDQGFPSFDDGSPLDQSRENAIYEKIESLFSEKEATFLKNIYQSIITESKKAEK